MPVTMEDGLRALREASELAPAIGVDLDPEYLRAIEYIERLPQNQTGADKTWVSRAVEAFDRHYAAARRD